MSGVNHETNIHAGSFQQTINAWPKDKAAITWGMCVGFGFTLGAGSAVGIISLTHFVLKAVFS